MRDVGPLPEGAEPTPRELGRVMLELDRKHYELEALRSRPSCRRAQSEERRLERDTGGIA